MTRMFSISMLAALLLAMAPTDAQAQSRGKGPPRPVPAKHAPVAGKVNVSVQVVHATNNGKVDPRLRNVVNNLKFTRYTGFQLLDSPAPAKLAPGQAAQFNIAGGRRIKVDVISRDARAAKVRVRMLNAQGKVLDTTVSIHRNRSFMIAGPDHKGGKLVLPVTVKY